jgi:hypothetical protein
VGQILALVILYEINDIKRFLTVQNFSSYARLIKPVKESNGKWAGKSNKKIGNHHLKWAIKEAAILMLRSLDQAKELLVKTSSTKTDFVLLYIAELWEKFFLDNRRPYRCWAIFLQLILNKNKLHICTLRLGMIKI